MKKVWFYKKDDQKEGPVARDEIEHLLATGAIDETTLVWTESLGRWVAISELEHFHFNALDVTPTVTVEKAVHYERETDEGSRRPRPWVRYWARMADYALFSAALTFGMSLAAPITYMKQLDLLVQSKFWTVTILFLWVFVETVLLVTWGTTPGKWLLKVKLRSEGGKKLSFGDAINRSFSVWWLGLGIGIPLISFVTLIVAAVKLSNTGMTSWDRRGNYTVVHENIGATRTIFFILLFVILGVMAFSTFSYGVVGQ